METGDMWGLCSVLMGDSTVPSVEIDFLSLFKA